MSGARWEKAIGSINSYAHTLQSENVSAEITVAAFDSNGRMSSYNGVRGPQWGGAQMMPAIHHIESAPTMDFFLLRDNVDLKKFKPIDFGECSPRGGTPLYDATAKLINMADNRANEKTVIAIVTDGEENTSTTYNLTVIRDRINTCQTRGWEVIFMGAEFNADSVARSYGLADSKVINSSLDGMNQNMRFYATASANYATMGQAIDTTQVRSSLKL